MNAIFRSPWLTFALIAAVGILSLVSFFVDPSASGAAMLLAEGVVALDAETLQKYADEFKQAIGRVKKSADDVSTAIEKSEKERTEQGKVLDATKNEIVELGKKHATLDESMKASEQKLIEMINGISKSGPGAKPKTIGQLVVESEAAKGFTARFKGQAKAKGMSDEIALKDITSVEASAGDGIWSAREQEIVKNPYRPLTMRSLIPTVPVGSNLVEWVQINSRTNNAAAVSEGGLKPKSDLTYDKKQTAVTKLAHYFKASMEVLQDMPRLRAEIDSEGIEMLRQEEEDQILAGDGTGENLLGLIPQATAFNTGLSQPGDTPVDTVRRAILQVRQSYYSATGIVLNPADWADIELLKDGEDRYLFSLVTSGATRRLWGLPVVEADSLSAGEFMVGAFATAATLYDRMVLSVFMSTENQDDFIRNLVTILFEERIALAVKRPLAFVHGDLPVASS